MPAVQKRSGLRQLANQFRDAIEHLTGQQVPLADRQIPDQAVRLLEPHSSGVGYTQFNELLLTLGYDRVGSSFFQFLVDGGLDYELGTGIRTLRQFERGVDRFRSLALLYYGNVKFGFKQLSIDREMLISAVRGALPEAIERFTKRHAPVLPIVPIAGDHTYYLGYLIQKELADRLSADPNDRSAQRDEGIRKKIVEQGRRNHEAYLCSDHLDVYVATSMRARHEFVMVNDLTREIFSHQKLSKLNLRWFDPTQAYCTDRLDKGLAEALMLKRARCTVYLAQEIDTLGKDSELASTLAQGKVVIAFVPKGDGSYLGKLLERLRRIYPDKSEREIVLDQMRLFWPDAAWEDKEVRGWLNNRETFDLRKAKSTLAAKLKDHCDRRAATLKETHPLGIQVNLETGVANGVLVVRTADECAELIRRVLLRELEFQIDSRTSDGNQYWLLRETISGCVYRVMTGDRFLTNAFWNFYLDPSGGSVAATIREKEAR
jgi:hypothetical protein